MSDYPKCTWQGGSGEKYEFSVLPIDFSFKEDQDGNYNFAKKIDNVCYAIYIGEGDLKERTEFRINDGCVVKKSATHIHAHINSNETSRKLEEQDLLNGNEEAYSPTGCNIKKGG